MRPCVVGLIATAAALVLGGCRPSPEAELAASARSEPVALSGAVTIDGSSTVLPVTSAMASAFTKQQPGVQISSSGSGTSEGFKKLCAGEIPIAGASRPINAAEMAECSAHRVDFIELPIAFDSLSVVVSRDNSFVSCLTVAELKRLWEPAAEGRVTRWNQVRAGFPDRPVTLFGPGTESGTFDYFTLAIVGTQSRSRKDYTSSADDGFVANGVAANPDALGYFGYAYYLENKERLKIIGVDGGHGCITPAPETVAEGTYEPLSRPIFLYASRSAVTRPEVLGFLDFYVSPERTDVVRTIGYVPLPPATLLSVARRLDTMTTGSIFGGRGSVLGVTAQMFEDEDRIKSAIVR